jgi:hypothetical protein
MNENTLREVLRKDLRVKELIGTRAYQLYLSRRPEEGSTEDDWYRAELEVIDDLIRKLIEAEAEAWQIADQQKPELQEARSFATLVGFKLSTDGIPSRSDLFDSRYFTIGLSYITGMFQIGRRIEEESFLRYFSNDDAVVKALLYRIRTDPSSPYRTESVETDLRVNLVDGELSSFLAHAENEARRLFGLFKKMLLATEGTESAQR